MPKSSITTSNKNRSLYLNTFVATADAQDPAVPSDKSCFTFKSKRDLTFHLWSETMSDYHRHENYFEIFLITEGRVLHNFQGEEYVMKKGDAFIIFPNQYHCHSQYKNYTSRHINLTCSIPFASSLFRVFFDSNLFDCPQEIVRFNASELDIALKLQDLILKTSNEEDFNAYIQSLMVVMLRIYHQRMSNSDRVDGDMPKWLQRFVQYLQNIDMSAPIQMSELYTASGVSQSKLSREFKKYTGKTLISYVTDLRLNYACNLLKTTSFSANKISEMCGFENYTSFWRVFKSKYSVTPVEYRDIHANPNLE